MTKRLIPRTGDTSKDPALKKTNENIEMRNLTPFMHLSPGSATIFDGMSDGLRAAIGGWNSNLTTEDARVTDIN